MTCIAYRDGVMAGDGQASWARGVKQLLDVKVVKAKGHLFGVTGSVCPDTRAAADWFLAGAERYPHRAARFELLVVHPDGTIESCDWYGTRNVIHEAFWAVGCGATAALGAMEMGADARQAVKAAIKWVDGCGGRVTWRKLKGD